MNSELFLIDSNSLITPYNTFYPFDFAWSFWDQMARHIESGSIVILDIVRNEISKKDDNLSRWFRNIEAGSEIDHRQNGIPSVYGKILQSIQMDSRYQPAALLEWASGTVADPWLIAAASVYSCTIITFEKLNTNLSAKNPSKNPKIPNVAADFGVKVENLYYMMRALNFRL